MKILIFAPYYTPHIYGLSVHIDEFSKALSPKVKKITIFTPHLFKNSPKNEIRHGNIEVVRFPAFYIVFNYPFPKLWKIDFWRLLFTLFKDDKYDLVISNMRFFIINLPALFYSKIKKVKWVHIEHGSNFIFLSNKIKEAVAMLYDLTLGFAIFKLSDLNIATSSEMKKFIQRFDVRDVPVIFNSLNIEDVDKIKPSVNLRGLFKDKAIVSFLGRICKYKNIESSVRMIKSLPGNIKNKLIFFIIGYGEDYEKIKKIVKNEPSIKLLGELPRNTALGILKISDIYIHSSLPGGGVSSALQEAMYCKCAVLATPNEGAADTITDGMNGLTFHNETEMRKKLINLINNKEQRIILGERAQQNIRENFNWKKAGDKYYELFDNLLNK